MSAAQPTHPDNSSALAHLNLRTTAEEGHKSHKKSKEFSNLVLMHAFECTGCPQIACQRMKRYWRHRDACQRNQIFFITCGLCQHLEAVWHFHYTQCKVRNCSVPRCYQIRRLSAKDRACFCLKAIAVRGEADEDEDEDVFY